jgi:hypothetical protein
LKRLLTSFGKDSPNIGYFKVFGCKCFIRNDKDNLGKFDAKSNEGTFLGYSMNGKAYRVYNKRSLTIEESIYVVFDEVDSLKPKNIDDDDDDDINVIENKVNNIKVRDQTSQNSNKEESMKNASHLEQDQQFPKSRPSRPDMDLLWEESSYSEKAVTEDRPNEAIFHPDANSPESDFERT